MKKFITLALVLVLALGLAVPAMAFTSDTSATVKHPFDLKIYLVEYDDNDLFGVATLPESDRGYAKNEIVAAIVELFVPKNENPATDFGSLEFGGKNIKLDVSDNKTGTLQSIKTAASTDKFTINDDADKMVRDAGLAGLNPTKDTTYKWLFFAKVTGDEASLYAQIVDKTGNSGGFNSETSLLSVVLDGTTYSIKKVKTAASEPGSYTISWVDDLVNYKIKIDVDKNYKSTGMTISIDAKDYPLAVTTGNVLGYLDGAVVKTDGKSFDSVMDVYNDTVIDVFHLDYMLIGNYVRDSFFKDLTSTYTIKATVDIEPWTAYVTVPDNIVVDPPKTGDAASIMGFVMVALSGAGVVALRKRG